MPSTKIIAGRGWVFSACVADHSLGVRSTDSTACVSVQRDVLETTKLVGATIAYSGDIAKTWSHLYEALSLSRQ
jgi:hypothetical protein